MTDCNMFLLTAMFAKAESVATSNLLEIPLTCGEGTGFWTMSVIG